jgi:hypothetical protein
VFIVVEGPDGSGKSSLVAELVKQANENYTSRALSVFHMGRPSEESRRWCLDAWATRLESTNWSDGSIVAIADRWHWGEVTYAPVKRPHTNKDGYGLLGVAGWRYIELVLMSRGVIQFALLQPADVLIERVSARGDDFVDVSELRQIRDLYDLGVESAADVAVIRPAAQSRDSVPTLARTMLAMAKNREAAAHEVSNFPEYIGSLRPRALLVGDRRNGTDMTTLPFYPIHGNSGEYLLSCLPSPFWKGVGIVNGSESCGGRLEMLWKVLGKPPVIALGRMAEKSLAGARQIPRQMIRVVPHPQYIRRFHHQDRIEYGRSIERLAVTLPEEDTWILR